MTAGGFAEWIGRSIEERDEIVEGAIRRLAATLGHDGMHGTAATLPPLGHWLFHLPSAPRETLGRDGHPALGTFLPPIAQPRRMWAGGRLRFLHPVPIGASLVKRTTIAAVTEKSGVAGAMTFVTLRHALGVDGVPAIEEEQDLVFLPIAPPAAPRPMDLPAPERERCLIADETLLFRFSALTFNAHRIHYDLAYARDVELYPAIVVHGPLQAMLLLRHALPDVPAPTRFEFRARAPLYAGRAFTLAYAAGKLWIRDEAGAVTMTASVA